jgi:hypothetical protein
MFLLPGWWDGLRENRMNANVGDNHQQDAESG